jgi:RNA polymerase sigma-70 factor (ECF subfamily)
LDLDSSFGALYEREARRVLRFLRNAVEGQAQAEDICADVFSAAWKSWSRFRGSDADARAWLFRIARNHVIDAHRRTRRVRLISLDDAASATSTHGVDAGDMLDLRRALGRLGVRERSLLALRAAGLSHEEVADIHGMRPDTARVAWHRAARHLRDLMEAE